MDEKMYEELMSAGNCEAALLRRPLRDAEIDAATARGEQRAADELDKLLDRVHDLRAPRRLDPAALVVAMPLDGFSVELPLEEEPFPVW